MSAGKPPLPPPTSSARLPKIEKTIKKPDRPTLTAKFFPDRMPKSGSSSSSSTSKHSSRGSGKSKKQRHPHDDLYETCKNFDKFAADMDDLKKKADKVAEKWVANQMYKISSQTKLYD